MDDNQIPVEIVKTPPPINSYFKTLFAILGVFILVAGLRIAVKLSQQKQETRTKASVSLVDLSLSPDQTQITPGQDVNIAVGMNPHDYKVTAVDLKIAYDSSRFDFVSFNKTASLPTVLTAATAVNGIVSTVLGSEASNPSTGSSVIANLILKAKAGVVGAGLIQIIENTQVAGIDSSGNAVPSSLLGDAGSIGITVNTPIASPTPTPTPTPTPFPTAITSSEIKDDFDGSLDLTRWSIWKYPSGAPTQSQIKNSSFVHFVPAGLKEYVAAVADTKTLKGDFDVIVDLKGTADLVFHDDSWKNTLGVTLLNLGGTYGFSTLDNKQTNTEIKTGLSLPLTVRLIRIDKTIYYYYKSTQGWEKIGSFAGIYNGEGKIALQTSTRTPDYPEVTGTFDNFIAKVNIIGATNACGGTCGSNNNCNTGLMCYGGFCRNPQCKENSDCNCASVPVPTISKPTPTPYKIVVDLKPTPVSSAKPTPKTDMRIYNLDLETPVPTPTPQKQSFLGKIVGFFLKLFGIKY